MELSKLSTLALLRLYADILTELVRRGVVRSRNAPSGDLAEYLVAEALGGELAPASEKSWDVRIGDKRVQVKVRLVVAGDRRSQNYSVFRSWEFDTCVFLLLGAHDYSLLQAVEVPVDGVRALARDTTWVKGFRIGTRVNLLAAPGAIDRSAELQRAFAALGADHPSKT